MVQLLNDRYKLGRQAITRVKPLDALAAESGLSVRYVRQLRQVAKRIDRKTFDAICARWRRPAGLPLHVGHIVVLAMLPKLREVQRFARLAAANNWTPKQLHAAIREELGEQGTHGRSLKEGHDVVAVLNRLAADGEEWACQLRRAVLRFASDEQTRKQRIRRAGLGKQFDDIRRAIATLRRAFNT